MNEQLTESRGSLLDVFARATERAPAEPSMALTTVGAAPPVERVIGAQQIAIPRDEMKVLEKIKVLANAAGSDWYYRYPVKSKGGTEFIEGPSIKLANDLARLYGNCEIETKVTDLGDSWLIYARFTDYETGFAMTRPFQQRKGQRGMRTGDDRALDIAFQIGASKAIRNVIVNSLQTFADFAFDEARNALVERIAKNVEGWRERCVQRIVERKIESIRVERVVGRAIKDWTAPDIARVVAMMQSIADGMTSVDEVFPSIPEVTPPETATKTPHHTGEADAQAAGAADQEERSARAPDAAERQEELSPVELAYEQGKAARTRGGNRKAIPGEYRANDKTREALAWFAGFDGIEMPTSA
jgi:hypothetical protein